MEDQGKQKIKENELESNIYSWPQIPKWFWPMGLFLLFFISFVNNFPLKKIIQFQVATQIKSLGHNCPMDYSNLDVEYFLPKVLVHNLIISGSCFNNPQNSLTLPLVNLTFRGPSFYPLGLKFLLSPQMKKSYLNLFYTISFSQQLLRIEEAKIQLEEFSVPLGLPLIKGEVSVDALLALKGSPQQSSLGDLNFLIKSKNLEFPAQKISTLDLPALSIGNFVLKGIYENNKLKIAEFVVGNVNSPIIAQYTGEINLNPNNFLFSPIDLTGEVKFSEEFVQSFGILKLLLKKYNNKNGFYQMKLRGTLQNPLPLPL